MEKFPLISSKIKNYFAFKSTPFRSIQEHSKNTHKSNQKKKKRERRKWQFIMAHDSWWALEVYLIFRTLSQAPQLLKNHGQLKLTRLIEHFEILGIKITPHRVMMGTKISFYTRRLIIFYVISLILCINRWNIGFTAGETSREMGSPVDR